jgi:hypothetical protein
MYVTRSVVVRFSREAPLGALDDSLGVGDTLSRVSLRSRSAGLLEALSELFTGEGVTTGAVPSVGRVCPTPTGRVSSVEGAEMNGLTIGTTVRATPPAIPASTIRTDFLMTCSSLSTERGENG